MSSTEEQRTFSRIDVKSSIRYRIEGQDEIQAGLLDNVSATGVLFWSRQSIEFNAKVLLFVEAEETEQAPIKISATVTRIIPAGQDGRFGYGCRISETMNAGASLLDASRI